MITQISYNVLIERFKAFASGHYLIEGFTHGHPSAIDIQKDITFPWMHVFPIEVEPRAGSRLYSFIITFADLPRDKETPAEYQREVISDCIKLAEDFVAEVQNGLTLFGPTVELEGSPSIEVFIDEYSQTLTGVNLAVTLSVPWDWSACDIPADFAVSGSGSGGGGAGGGGIILKTNGVLNGSQSLLDLVEGTNITITDNGSGVVTISASGGGGGGSVSSVGLTMPTAFAVAGSPVTSSGTLAVTGAGTSLEYIDGAGDLQTFPTIPTLTSELTNDSGFIVIGDVPPQVNADWVAVGGVDEILNKPTLAAVATSGDYNDLSNLPTIPTALDDLSDVNAPTPSNGQTLIYNSASGDWEAVTPASGGTVTSVALTMPGAFTVGGSPITTAGTLAVTGAGVASQYIRGDGTLANFPTGGGGGASVNYYLNGSVSQGTIGGAVFQQLNKTAVIGAGTDFIRTNAAGDGYITQFITDANDPAQLLIPSGNWHFETFFSASSSGGNPSFYIELYKYDGATLTLIASNSANPELITAGTVIDLYTTVISVPATVLTASERIAIRIFVVTSGRTLTLHTEGPHLSEIVTTFSTGLTALNSLTAQVQSLTTGTAGSDFAISSAGSVHTFNLPTASALNRGALSSADWATFNGKQNSIGLTTVGTNLATLPDPSAISFIRVNADNTVTARTPAQVLTDLGVAATIILGRDFTPVVVSNTTTNTLVYSLEIPSNTLQANDFIELISHFNSTTPNGIASTYRVYVNTSAAIGGTQIGLFTNTVGTPTVGFMRNIFVTAIGVSGNLRLSLSTASASNSYVVSSGSASNITINTTASVFVVIAIQMGNATSTASIQGTIIKLIR